MEIKSRSKHVNIGDTRLFIVERGEEYPVIVLHGGPGLDHHEFADYLDPLCDQFRLILVDMRAQGKSDMCPKETWTLEQMAKDVVSLAGAMSLDRYAVLGHSYGAFVALQNAVDFPGAAAQTIVSGGVPSSRFLEVVDKNLAEFEPESLREQVADSWAREAEAQTQEDFASLMHDQMPRCPSILEIRLIHALPNTKNAQQKQSTHRLYCNISQRQNMGGLKWKIDWGTSRNPY